MKVCFFNCAKVWGGGEKWHLDHALALQNEGHEIVLISNKNSELYRRALSVGIRTIAMEIGNLSFLNPWKLHVLFYLFRKEHFDVLVMNFSKDLKIAAPLARLIGIRKIIYRRGSAIPIKNTFLNRFIFSKCLTGIIANSEATKRTILQNNPELFPAEKIEVIYNGIATQNPQFIENQNSLPVIGNLGRLVPQKNQEMLLDIAYILKQRGVKCLFRIGGDGVLMKQLQEKVLLKNLSDYVEFTGFVDNPNTFLQQIDLFVLTSRWEGFGYVLAEAMLAHKPLVAFDISSNPELITDGVNGYLVPWGKEEVFADKIQYLIENPLIRKELGNNGYEIVCRTFDLEKNKRKVMEFLFNTI